MTVCYMFSVTCYNPSNGSIRPLCICVDCATLSSLSWTERLSPGDLKAEAFIFTCLTTPAVLNEFCGDYSHGYFWNGFKSDFSLDPHKVSTMCTALRRFWSSVGQSLTPCMLVCHRRYEHREKMRFECNIITAILQYWEDKHSFYCIFSITDVTLMTFWLLLWQLSVNLSAG